MHAHAHTHTHVTQVESTESGSLRTTEPLHGCHYTFDLQGSQLTVLEEDDQGFMSGHVLELLDGLVRKK